MININFKKNPHFYLASDTFFFRRHCRFLKEMDLLKISKIKIITIINKRSTSNYLSARKRFTECLKSMKQIKPTGFYIETSIFQFFRFRF